MAPALHRSAPKPGGGTMREQSQRRGCLLVWSAILVGGAIGCSSDSAEGDGSAGTDTVEDAQATGEVSEFDAVDDDVSSDVATDTPPVDTCACDDGLWCNGQEECDDAGACIEGEAPDCDDEVGCTADACSEAFDICTHLVASIACDDGLACNGQERCDAEAGCQPGAMLTCDDSVGCTTDSCSESDGGCVSIPSASACDDGDACNGFELCDPATGCVGSDVDVVCDDGVACTVDSCDPDTGECVTTVSAAACDDGNPCNGAELCHPVSGCVAGLPPTCNDGVACTLDSCTSGVGCVTTPQHAMCDDGLWCNGAESCATTGCEAGSAEGCDDGIDCTDDLCDEAEKTCLNIADHDGCLDDDACNGLERCGEAGCENGAGPNCVDGNPCTTDGCDVATGCTFTPASGGCDDGSVCTVNDVCAAGKCVGMATDCSDDNPCTADICDPISGCGAAPTAGACDDTDPCTTGDVCIAGQCNGKQVCGCTTAADCDDDEICTVDSCVAGQCVYDPADGACDDDNACTLQDVCIGGTCAGSDAPECDDDDACTTDSCDPVLGCVGTVASGDACDDGDACTLGETCATGECGGGTAVTCDDNNPCTVDLCSSALGCASVAQIAPCDDGDACTTADLCKSGVCNGQPLNCADGNPCTTDGCTDGECDNVALATGEECSDDDPCVVSADCQDGLCLANETLACDDQNPCTVDVCQSGVGCATTPGAGACDDDDPCTAGDTCQSGTCVGASATSCDDLDPCTTDSCQTGVG
ncbi:MAG: hypothetical protein ACI9OJ_005306, partial [Myxococcota bacterium]